MTDLADDWMLLALTVTLVVVCYGTLFMVLATRKARLRRRP